MRIADVTLKNFRAFGDSTTIPLGTFSTIVGRNDTGKSSILHALDIFFNRNPDPDDFSRRAEATEPCEITVAFTDLPEAVELEDGVQTSLAEENLLDGNGNLVIARTYSRTNPRRPVVWLRVLDFVAEEFQSLCSKNESALNVLGRTHNLEFSRAGRGITNKAKRAQLREQARAQGIQLGNVDVTPSEELMRKLLGLLPPFSLFTADWRLSEEETPFQRSFRDMVDQETRDRPDRRSIEAFVQEFIDGEVAKIHRFLLTHTDEISLLKAQLEFKWRDVVAFRLDARDRQGLDVPLGKRGSGLRRLVMVSYFQYLASKGREGQAIGNHIFGIEEPETYLHPGAQRELLQSLRTIADNNQVIVTSHSPVFAGATEPSGLVWVSRNGDAVQISHSDTLNLEGLAIDLGVEPSDQIYGYRACVFVEGHEDILFLETVTQKLKAAGRIDATLSDRQIGIVPVGGIGNLKHWVNRKAMRALTRQYGVFVDSDRRSADEGMRPDRQRWKEECQADGAIFCVTRKREIENYLHPDVVREQTGREIVIDDFSDVKTAVGDGCIGLIQHMSVEQFLERDRYTDQHGNELHELVEVVSGFLALA